MGNIVVFITNTLNEDFANEAIAIGDLKLEYEYDESKQWVEPATLMYEEDDTVENPLSLWTNNCGATEKECQGH